MTINGVSMHYAFAYQLPWTGELSQVTLPYGGYVRWNVATWNYTGNRSLRDVSYWVHSKSGGAGDEKSYAIAHEANNGRQTLHNYTMLGLIEPARRTASGHRLYDEQQLRHLRIVALLRQANYDFAAIRTTLAELEAGQPQRAVAAVEERRSELAGISWRCLQALAALHGYASEFLEGIGIV